MIHNQSRVTEGGELETAGPLNYVPAIRWKRGEIGALRHQFADGLPDAVVPLLLIDNVRERQQHEKKGKVPITPAGYIDFIANEMLNLIQRKRAFVDTQWFDAMQGDADGLRLLFENMTAKLSALVPVVRISDKASRRMVIRERAAQVGVAVRLRESQFAKSKQLEKLLQDLAIDASVADLILDLGPVEEERHDASSIADWVKRLGRRNKAWRSVTLLAGSYPKKVRAKPDDVLQFVRYDYKLYCAVSELLLQEELELAFGDFGIMHPEAEPTSGSQSGGGGWPIIRYCTTTDWMVYKPKTPVNSAGVSTYFELARKCASAATFMGERFSHGDSYIAERATMQGLGPGNSTTYVSADANHHIAFVAAQRTSAPLDPEPVSVNDLVVPTMPAADSSDEEFWD